MATKTKVVKPVTQEIATEIFTKLSEQLTEINKVLATQTEELEQQHAMIREMQKVPIKLESPLDWNKWFDNKPQSPTDSTIPMLHRAEELINGARQQDYGDKLQNFSQIAMLWQGILATKLQLAAFITAEDVALCMMAVKMARLAKSPDHSDSILDVAGYAGCYDKLQQERKSGIPLQGAIFDPRNGQQ